MIKKAMTAGIYVGSGTPKGVGKSFTAGSRKHKI